VSSGLKVMDLRRRAGAQQVGTAMRTMSKAKTRAWRLARARVQARAGVRRSTPRAQATHQCQSCRVCDYDRVDDKVGADLAAWR
jgi:hypothetical protein